MTMFSVRITSWFSVKRLICRKSKVRGKTVAIWRNLDAKLSLNTKLWDFCFMFQKDDPFNRFICMDISWTWVSPRKNDVFKFGLQKSKIIDRHFVRLNLKIIKAIFHKMFSRDFLLHHKWIKQLNLTFAHESWTLGLWWSIEIMVTFLIVLSLSFLEAFLGKSAMRQKMVERAHPRTNFQYE